MKLSELDKFIKDNELLQPMKNEAGIYAITIDSMIAYIGKSKKMYDRCRTHIYNVQNAGFQSVEKKYKLLLAAQLGGHRIDCLPIRYCEEDELGEYEDKYLEEVMPPLNILTPLGKQDITNLTIFELKDKLEYRWSPRMRINRNGEDEIVGFCVKILVKEKEKVAQQTIENASSNYKWD